MASLGPELTRFVQVATTSLGRLREALDTGRASETLDPAHTLAVAAAEAEEIRIYAAARAIEALADDGTVIGMEPHLSTISAALSALTKAS